MKLFFCFLLISTLGLCLTGCIETSSAVRAKEKPESVKTTYQNGRIVSNHVIMVNDFNGFNNDPITPGVIVQLDSGEVVQIKLCNSTPEELKNYKFNFDEKVRCKTQSDRQLDYREDRWNQWNLVPLEKKS